MKAIRRGPMADFWDIYGKTLKINLCLTAGHRVSGNTFERRKHFKAKCERKDWLVYSLRYYHPCPLAFISPPTPAKMFAWQPFACHILRTEWLLPSVLTSSTTKFRNTCYGDWYELRLESLNNPNAIKFCKMLPWCHGLYRCTQMRVSSFFLHTKLKTSEIYFLLHFPCAWGLRELILVSKSS